MSSRLRLSLSALNLDDLFYPSPSLLLPRPPALLSRCFVACCFGMRLTLTLLFPLSPLFTPPRATPTNPTLPLTLTATRSRPHLPFNSIFSLHFISFHPFCFITFLIYHNSVMSVFCACIVICNNVLLITDRNVVMSWMAMISILSCIFFHVSCQLDASIPWRFLLLFLFRLLKPILRARMLTPWNFLFFSNKHISLGVYCIGKGIAHSHPHTHTHTQINYFCQWCHCMVVSCFPSL